MSDGISAITAICATLGAQKMRRGTEDFKSYLYYNKRICTPLLPREYACANCAKCGNHSTTGSQRDAHCSIATSACNYQNSNLRAFRIANLAKMLGRTKRLGLSGIKRILTEKLRLSKLRAARRLIVSSKGLTVLRREGTLERRRTSLRLTPSCITQRSSLFGLNTKSGMQQISKRRAG
jgi:hypothetical protein